MYICKYIHADFIYRFSLRGLSSRIPKQLVYQNSAGLDQIVFFFHFSPEVLIVLNIYISNNVFNNWYVQHQDRARFLDGQLN